LIDETPSRTAARMRTDFGDVSDIEVRKVQDKLNNRPRKCLGWRTHREVI
jgi:IS30 family transposase